MKAKIEVENKEEAKQIRAGLDDKQVRASPWTEVVTKQLKVLVAEGLSFGKIANLLGIGRNACIGKSSRMGLVQPNTRKHRALKIKVEVRAQLPPRQRVHLGNQDQFIKCYQESDLAPTLDDTKIAGKTLLQLGQHDCRFPIGQVGDPDFRFCAEPILKGCSYCAEHARRCFTQVSYNPNRFKWRPGFRML